VRGIIMKVCIAYESKYGNGKKCVEHLEKTIRAKGHNVEVFSIREVKPNLLPQADIYVFSTPTHIGGPPGKMKKFLKKLDVKQEGARYSLITTCMDTNTRALEKMTDLLQPHKLTKAAEGIKIKVNGMKGPLWDGYQKQIEVFANNILTKK
jgi:flavodoxin